MSEHTLRLRCTASHEQKSQTHISCATPFVLPVRRNNWELLIRLHREDEQEALPPRTHSPFKSEPLSGFILEFFTTFQVATSISPAPPDDGFHMVRDFAPVAAAWCRGREAVYVHLEGLTCQCERKWHHFMLQCMASGRSGNDHAQTPPKAESLRVPVFRHHIPQARVSVYYLHSCVGRTDHMRTPDSDIYCDATTLSSKASSALWPQTQEWCKTFLAGVFKHAEWNSRFQRLRLKSLSCVKVADQVSCQQTIDSYSLSKCC